MLRPRSPQESFYGSYLYDKIVPADHLTSTSVMTDTNGDSLGAIKYLPFGECRNSPPYPTDILFTGQRLDDTGLYYYNSRYYDPTIGRFISADTIIPNPSNPQSFNRYSYCLNNPLKYIDPSGHLSGTVTIGGVTYTLVDEGNGIHHLEHPDGGVTVSAPLDELIDLISDEMIFEGDFSHGGNVYIGAVVKIDVQTGYWNNPTFSVYYVPEGSFPAMILRDYIGASSISVHPIGVFVRYQGYSAQDIEQFTLHELDHRVWQGRLGPLWYTSYGMELLLEWAYYGGDFWEGPYATNSWEQSARRMAGQPTKPNPTSWWESGWENFTQGVEDLATDIADFFKDLWPW